MSYGVSKQKITNQHEEYILSCCECGMQFVLYGAIVVQEDNDIHLIRQDKIDYCPYCGFNQKVN